MAAQAQREIPVIDVGGLLRDSGEATLRGLAARIEQACRGSGFFYLANHGVARELIDDAFEANRWFHALPMEEKLQRRRNQWHRGYVPPGGNVARSSARFAATQHPNMVESFSARHEISSDHPDYQRKPFQGPNEWPDHAPFRHAVERYVAATTQLGMSLLAVVSLAVGERQDFLAQFFQPPSTNLRLLHYPPAAVMADKRFRLHPHTDFGFLTILAQDDAGGLQVQRVDGSWIEAPSLPGTFVVNVGDMLARWTNDVFNSTPHRVVAPAQPRDRYSMALFFDPSLDAVIRCLPRFTGPGTPAKYAPVRYGEYYAARADENYSRRMETT